MRPPIKGSNEIPVGEEAEKKKKQGKKGFKGNIRDKGAGYPYLGSKKKKRAQDHYGVYKGFGSFLVISECKGNFLVKPSNI